MTSITIRVALLAGLAMVCFGGGAASAKDKYYCMTDDGYGRLRPCSSGYKAAHRNWRDTEACMTDDGYGRKRPCSAGFKPKQQ